jgi:STE24 endopeptidase
MDWIAAAIYSAIALSAALGVYLKWRQSAAAVAHRDAVPPEFAGTVGLEEHRRAADYTVASMRLSGFEAIFDAALAVLWLSLWLAPLYDLLSRVLAPGLSLSVAVVAAVTAIDHILRLPLSLVETFVVETRFGFNRTTLGRFFIDQAKGAALWAALVVPLLYGLFFLLRIFPDYWWLLAFAASMALMVAIIVIYPIFIAPLFNRFTPLSDEELKARMEALLAKCGFESDGLFVMDASTRSSHGNAYFSGLGKAKRIVFFDTLLQQHTRDEILAILAHELGHYKFGHVRQRLAQAGVFAFAAFATLYWAFSAGGLARRFGLPEDPGLVFVIVTTASGPILHLLSPVTSWLSRRAEFQADAFAKKVVGKEPMVSALAKLSRDNLSTLTPDRLYALFYYSHPPVPLRIAALDREGA